MYWECVNEFMVKFWREKRIIYRLCDFVILIIEILIGFYFNIKIVVLLKMF